MVIMQSKQQKNGWWQVLGKDGIPLKTEDCAPSKELIDAGVKTITDVLHFSAQKYQNKECLGTRQLLLRHSSKIQGKIVERLELGDYQWLTYKQMDETVQAVGSALQQMGFKCGEQIALFAETRAEWLLAAGGILKLRMSVCTLYSTLSDAGVIHALNETEVPLVFTTYDLFPRLISLLERCPHIKTIVVMEDQLEGVGQLDSVPDGVEIISFKSLVKQGKLAVSVTFPIPQEDDTAIIMYTSGSTGTPKGVLITHKNVLIFVNAYFSRIAYEPNSRYLAFLPLAHIMELVTEMSLLSSGIQVFYSSPGTLTSSSVKIFPGTEGDAKIAKPTLMNCVPLVLDKVIKGVTQKVEQEGYLKSFIFKKLVGYKFWLDYIPLTSSILDFLVFKKVKTQLGGHLKTLVVGGAPLSAQTQDHFRALFGCNIQVGYGLTETAACATCMVPFDKRSGHTGPPNVEVMIKLVNWEEGGYRVTDEPNPRGEIIIGGPSVAKGYFKRPKEMAEVFFEENGVSCFRTGDIGEIDQYGCVKIIDRLKDLVKMKHGEYVSLGHIESVLKTMPLIDNICVFADSSHERVVAVVVPVPEVLLAIGKEQTVTALTSPELDNMAHLYTNRVLNKLIVSSVQEHAKQCQLNKWETPAAILLSCDIWVPESNLVTAAHKLRRKQLFEHYRDQVQVLFRSIA